ncbi:hypothetical protein FB451DRAFT_1193396 [Mycena latifolia]|nr:hypothetical protein FB451DRAFT_1193396 [Mycena latifolia]
MVPSARLPSFVYSKYPPPAALARAVGALSIFRLNKSVAGDAHYDISEEVGDTSSTSRKYQILDELDEEGAEKDLVDALAIVPDDAAIAGELAGIRKRKKEKREMEKKQFKKVFA